MEIQWTLPTDLLSASVAIMRPPGMLGNEGLALWFGKVNANQVEVTHVVAVHGPGFQSAPLQLRLSFRAFEVLTDLADKIDAYLVGQIHSHPGLMLDLSMVDATHGIRRQDYLSLVCPYYAQRDVSQADQCGVHMFDGGTYRRLSPIEVSRRIRVSDAKVIQVSCEVSE